MDGNRRWATKQGLSKTEGHKAGLDTLLSCVSWCNEYGVQDVAFYAFSTENWKRTKSEVNSLMSLFEHMLVHQRDEILKHNVRMRFVGEISRLPKKIRVLAEQMERDTKKYDKTIWLCVSYGGRSEIVNAARQVTRVITETKLEKKLWTSDMPDLDLIIRTGGNHRLSNFLLWKASYAELYFTETPWPAFTKQNLARAFRWYEKNTQVNKGR